MLLGKAWTTCGSDTSLSRFVHVSSLTPIAFSTSASISVRFLSIAVRYCQSLLTEKA